MKGNERYLKEALEGFQNNMGKASIYCFPPFDFTELVTNTILKYIVKRPDDQILIVVDKFLYRLKLTEKFREYNINPNVKILTDSYILDKYSYNYNLIIMVNTKNIELIRKLTNSSKFTFLIFTEKPNDNNFILDIREHLLPEIDTTVTNNDVIYDKLNSPVEETRIGVDISDDDLTEYKKYTTYINDSMKVFNNLDCVKKCRVGDIDNGISAAQYRYDLAIANNWNENLDTKIEFNKQIDEIYNPNSLYERANIVYNIFRERKNLLTDNKAKFGTIKEIIDNNPNKKILIVSLRGEYANEIQKYLNSYEIQCGCFHDEIESQYLKDSNGEIIKYKSGENKGKLKPFGATSLSKLSMEAFNRIDETGINCLCIKNASDKSLTCKVDIIIFTTPLCSDMNEFIMRFSNIVFPSPIIIYKIYCNNTIEYDKMMKSQILMNTKIIETEKEIKIDEKSGDIIL